MEKTAHILLRATMPRSQALMMLGLSAFLLLILADLLVFHIAIRPAPFSINLQRACWAMLIVMLIAVGASVRSWIWPPVLVEATTDGVRDAAKRGSVVIPWRAIASFSQERVIIGDSRAEMIVVRMLDSEAKEVYLPSSANPGGQELLEQLDRFYRAYR